MAAVDYIFPDIKDDDFKARLSYYITHMKGGYFLRKFDLKNQSCYVSSVVYILIGMFSHLPIDAMTAKIKRVLNFRNFQTPLLRNIVGSNAADITSIRISSFAQVDGLFENGILFLGLVTTGGEGAIQHYFLVKQHPDGKHSILSSYGSSDVAMRQFQTELDTKEMDDFMTDLAEQEKSDEAKTRIRDFMEKYFLNKTYGTIQRKTLSDMQETYGEDETFRPDDIRWKKNQDADIAREIAYYQKGPIDVMLFPNIVGAFNTELTALELIDAKTAYDRSEITYDEYSKTYEKWNEVNKQLLKKLEDIREKVEADPQLSPTPLAKIEDEIASFTPTKSELEESLQRLTLGSPKKVEVEPLSPSVERLRQESKTPERADAAEPELTPEEIDELGFISYDDIGPVKLDDKFAAQDVKGGRKTRKRKRTKKMKKMKKRTRKV